MSDQRCNLSLGHPEVDPPLDDSTRESDFAEEQRQHGGQVAARSLDGRTTYAYAHSWEELHARLKDLGIDPSTVIHSYVFPVEGVI